MELKDIMEIIQQKGSSPDRLIEILMEVQSLSDGHFISEEFMKAISDSLGIPFSKVYGVASFYSAISTKKRGKYVIQICNSPPCHLAKSGTLVKSLEEKLGIKVGDTTSDGLFTLEYTSCIGACEIAPAVRINDEVYGNLSREKINDLIDCLRRE